MLIPVLGHSQGCSDAGFCTVHSIKSTETDDFSSAGKNLIKTGASLGIAQYDVLIISPYVEYSRFYMKFKLSNKWKSVSEEIQIGLIQNLLLKVYKTKNKNTINMDLYESFLRNIGDYSAVEEAPIALEESFNRVNEKYFSGMMDRPNLIWGNHSFSKLGSYEYGSNTIMMTKVLEEDLELLDYVMYHELLHKKHKFYTKNGRSHHHTQKFRDDEKKFETHDIEKKLEQFLRKKKYDFKRNKAYSQIKKKKRLLDWFLN